MEPVLLALLRAIWALALSERGLTAPEVPPHDFCAQPCQLAQALPSLQGGPGCQGSHSPQRQEANWASEKKCQCH